MPLQHVLNKTHGSLPSSLVSVAFHGSPTPDPRHLGRPVGDDGTHGIRQSAHGAFAMAGGYVLTSAISRFGLSFPLALALAFIAVAAASVLLERWLYSRLYDAGELEQVLFTIGLIFMAVAAAQVTFGMLQRPVLLPDYLKGQISLLGRDFPAYRVFLIAVSSAMIAALWFGVERTCGERWCGGR
jgi:branched-chain amino acid transport system permease protein